ncbi:MAG: TetR/AcrR family transcriptional regulator [Candidatus Binataceae bacterium]
MRTKAGLTVAKVIAAAAELADRNGADALTLSALAAKLGVKPPSLFNHVSGMTALRRELRALALKEIGEAMGAAAIGRSRGDAIRALGHAYRQFVKRRPGIYVETVRALDGDDSTDSEIGALAARIIAICVSAFAGFGLSPRQEIHAIRALRSLAHGFSALEIGNGFGIPIALDESYDWMLENFIRGLEAGRAPSRQRRPTHTRPKQR